MGNENKKILTPRFQDVNIGNRQFSDEQAAQIAKDAKEILEDLKRKQGEKKQ